MGEHEQGEPTYVMGRAASETERLQRQAQLLNPSTRRLFAEAGVAAGMRILDVGSGAGDVALLAAELVGADGTVVGVDANPAVLATARERARAAGLANVTFIEGDLRTAEPSGVFDGVVGRDVLMYLPDPAAALRTLAGRVRPGGVIAFQEVDFTLGPIDTRPESLQQRFWGWARELYRRAGADWQMGIKLHQAFLDAGLPAPAVRLEAPVGGGPDYPGYRVFAEGWRSVLPLLERFGIATAEEVGLDTLAERLRDEVVGQGSVFMYPARIGAWTRKA